ncbi:MAG: DMT family transporter [Pseudomonadota bacterium]
MKKADPELGVILALGAGLILGLAVVVSRYAYDSGASGVAVAITRSIIMVLGFGIYVLLKTRDWHIPKSLIGLTIINGCTMGLMTFGNIGSIEFISIGLSQLLFFTFPVQIAIVVTMLGLEEVRASKMGCVFLAFIGLAIMLGSSLGVVDWRGTSLALMAGVATTINAILVMRFFREINVFLATFYFSVCSFVTLVLLAVMFAEFRLPRDISGWLGMIGVGVLQGLGTPMYLYAIVVIGALKAGMATNLQPPFAALMAWLLFGELLTVWQTLGGAIILLSIIVMQTFDLRRARELNPTR